MAVGLYGSRIRASGSLPMSASVALDARLVGGTNTGDSSYWTGLLHGLASQKLDYKILLLSNAARPQEIPWCENFEWVRVPARSSRLWSLVFFPLAARRLGARAIHTQYALSPLAGRRGITTIHDVSFFIGPEWFRPKDRFLLERTVPASARRAAAVITVSETSRAEIERFIPGMGTKVRVTPNGLSPWIRPMGPAEAGSACARLGVPQPFLLTVGTRWPRKNMRLAVDAVELLPSEIPHRLAITGKAGWGEQTVGPRSVATGYVSNQDLAALYSAASIYLAPSRHEGFGIPLLEAFACGCPVLCSTGGALPEVAGDAAEIVPTWIPQDWAATIQALLGDSSKLQSMRARGRERVKRFTWEETARLTDQIYLEVMG
jgi:glycosyltransferase involved in cell wall biosynthesis